MRVSKLCAAALVIFFSGAWVIQSTARENSESQEIGTNATPLEVSVKLEGGPGTIPKYIAYLSLGTNKLGFAMPPDFRVAHTEATKITLASADLNSLIHWQIVGPAPTNGAALDPAHYRALIEQRHPGVQILSEFEAVAGGRSGPAFESRWGAKGGLERQEYSAFIITPVGVVEYNLVSSLERYGTARQQMGTAMSTLRWSDEHGKLVMPVFSNRF